MSLTAGPDVEGHQASISISLILCVPSGRSVNLWQAPSILV